MVINHSCKFAPEFPSLIKREPRQKMDKGRLLISGPNAMIKNKTPAGFNQR